MYGQAAEYLLFDTCWWCHAILLGCPAVAAQSRQALAAATSQLQQLEAQAAALGADVQEADRQLGAWQAKVSAGSGCPGSCRQGASAVGRLIACCIPAPSAFPCLAHDRAL